MGALATVAAILFAAAGVLAGGCGENGSPGVAAEGGSSMTTALPALPQIDLAAPTSFETASFALG